MNIALKFVVSALCALICLSGCIILAIPDITLVPSAPQALDEKSKAFLVEPHESNIYVISDWGWWDAHDYYFLDDFYGEYNYAMSRYNNPLYREAHEKMLYLSSNQYRLERVVPGTHQFRARDDSTISLTTEAGRNYFVRFILKEGWRRLRYSWELIGEEEGRNLVLKFHLAGQIRRIF